MVSNQLVGGSTKRQDCRFGRRSRPKSEAQGCAESISPGAPSPFALIQRLRDCCGTCNYSVTATLFLSNVRHMCIRSGLSLRSPSLRPRWFECIRVAPINAAENLITSHTCTRTGTAFDFHWQIILNGEDGVYADGTHISSRFYSG